MPERLIRILPVVFVLLLGLAGAASLHAETAEYERPVDAAPTDEVIGEGYVTPIAQRPRPVPPWRQILDLALLALALLVAAWLIHERRNRIALVALATTSLAYFGFVREGCICPIGSIQNVALSVVDAEVAIPYFVIGIFVLPLLAALFWGRVFCGGVCALGAIQELVAIRTVPVPRRLDRALRILPWVYLAAAIGFAVLPSPHRDFVVCRFDPFVGFFRFDGPRSMMLFGGSLLLLGVFVGRPYCRWLCPYGALLDVCSRLAARPVSITPERELDCGLCHGACPYGAIERLRAQPATCLACARCYSSCPVHRGTDDSMHEDAA